MVNLKHFFVSMLLISSACVYAAGDIAKLGDYVLVKQSDKVYSATHEPLAADNPKRQVQERDNLNKLHLDAFVTLNNKKMTSEEFFRAVTGLELQAFLRETPRVKEAHFAAPAQPKNAAPQKKKSCCGG